MLLWIIEGKFIVKWQRSKQKHANYPFLIYYLCLVIGHECIHAMWAMVCTLDKKNYVSWLAHYCRHRVWT